MALVPLLVLLRNKPTPPKVVQLLETIVDISESEEVRQGQKVINEMITCLCKPNGDHT